MEEHSYYSSGIDGLRDLTTGQVRVRLQGFYKVAKSAAKAQAASARQRKKMR